MDKSQKRNTEQKSRGIRIHTILFQLYKIQNQGNSSNIEEIKEIITNSEEELLLGERDGHTLGKEHQKG